MVALTLVIVTLGAALAATGIVAYIREPRRLRSSVLVLAGAGITVMSGFHLAHLMEWLGPVPAVVNSLILLAFAVGYLVLTGFLLWNGLTMWRREGRSPGNLLSALLGIAMVLAPVALVATALVDSSSSAVFATAGV